MHGGAVETDFSTSDQHVVIPLDGDVPHVQHGSRRKTEPLRIRSKASLDQQSNHLGDHVLAQGVRGSRIGLAGGVLHWGGWGFDFGLNGEGVCFIALHQRSQRIVVRSLRFLGKKTEEILLLLLGWRSDVHAQLGEHVDVVVHALGSTTHVSTSSLHARLRVPMRRLAVAVVLTFLVVLGPSGLAAPNGVGEEGDDGCLCHGGPTLEDTIFIHGWPEVYEPEAVYRLHLNSSTSGDAKGGFRLVVDGGTLLHNTTSSAQHMDEGLTHVEPRSIHDGWFVTWVAPNASNLAVRAVLHLNHVNENGASDGDEWATKRLVAVGPNHEGSIEEPREDTLTPTTVGIALLGLSVTLGLLVVVVREPGEE